MSTDEAPPGVPISRPGTASRRLEELATRLRAHEPGVTPDARRHRWEAATALVLAPGPEDVEVAIIERSRRDGDRWSGQLAFPGGRRDPGDRHLAATAIRETREEVGVHLDEPLTRVAEQRARVRPGLVACYAFVLPTRPALVPQPTEVAAAWWVPLGSLTDPANATHVRRAGARFPAIDVQGRALWGLTLMLLERFAALADLDLATGSG
jgi:8-oxo-dGTP pyrophosphatase MutT (NUDIX family)